MLHKYDKNMKFVYRRETATLRLENVLAYFLYHVWQWRIQRQSLWGHTIERGARNITEVSGQSPQRGPGAEPLVRGQGCELLFALSQLKESDNLSWNLFFAEQKNLVGR